MSPAKHTEPQPAEQFDGWDKEVSPYHRGEVELHNRVGRADHQEAMARRIHRPFMPDQHREFFAQLPFVAAGSIDASGAPWASILFGQPGFVSTLDDRTLALSPATIHGDPFNENAVADAPVSFVGVELPTRRRNRVNAIVRETGAQLVTDVVQSFGNCPQYIHTRDIDVIRDPSVPATPVRETFQDLDDTARNIITHANMFFVASHNPEDDPRTNGGVDVNHRGGNLGFVKVDGNTLTIPDFRGNFAFNTLGNFVLNPKAGLVFVDVSTGDLLQMTGSVELLWDVSDEIAAFDGAQRAWRFHLDHGQRLQAASPLRFAGGEPSPRTLQTGQWLGS